MNYIRMVKNVLGKCTKLETLYRVDVNFDMDEQDVDGMIGRKAHILVIENEHLLNMIVRRYKTFFS